MMKIIMLAVVGLLPTLTYGHDLIILPPLAGKTGAEKLLIIIQGAFVANEHYAEIGQKIQEASDLKLWVAIPSFPLNCPNPGQISSKIEGAVRSVKAKGFPAVHPPTDVIVSGHSLGGIFSQGVVAKGGYAGLVLFGSYLSLGNTLTSWKLPTLTLGGELDGLTRITRIAREWQGMQTRIEEDGHDALYRFPVIVLPGQSHSQFCSGVNVTSFGLKDAQPSVTWPVAQAAIAEAVKHFLTLLTTPTDSAARTYVDKRHASTKEMLSGWLTAQQEEPEWCETAQKISTANITAPFHVNTTHCDNFAIFDIHYPSAQAADRQVNVVSALQYKLNPSDSSTIPNAATEVDCKILTEQAVAAAFKDMNATTAAATCKAANQAALERAYSLVPAPTLARYKKLGKPFLLNGDEKYSIGATWQAAGFGFGPDKEHVKVKSQILTVKDNVLCKLLSPARAVEYIMVDGQPRFDGTVP